MMSSVDKTSDESRMEDSSGRGGTGGAGGGAASSSTSIGSGTDATVVLSPSSYYSEAEICSSVADVVVPSQKEYVAGKVHNSFVTHALKRNVLAWCAATGLATTITIHFKGREFHLHKFPLVSRSGYMKGLLMDSKEVELSSECPGGPEIFEMVANFCYGSTILMEASSVAALRCMAEYLHMFEEYGKANLCQRSELYLTQVALRRWEDTIVVLHSCDGLMPLAEKLQIVSRCLDSLVIMASIEVVGPAERSLPVAATRNSSAARGGGCMQMEIAQSQFLMDSNCIQDLASLPCHLFVQLVVAMRKQSMQEKFVSYVITRFVDQWIVKPSANHHVQQKFEQCPSKLDQRMVVESVVSLLPQERNMVPTSFLSALLRCALACKSSTDCRVKLEKKIALQLEHASLADLLLPASKPKAEGSGSQVSKLELDSMENIIMLFISERQRAFNQMGTDPVSDFSYSYVQAMSAVGQIWDKYLSAIAHDASLTPAKFASLLERIPDHVRLTHDHAYEAIYNYLQMAAAGVHVFGFVLAKQAHPHITEGERLILCRTIDCNKLSAEACTHAVQNEFMPLRVLVQAMFTQRLQPCATPFGHHTPACFRINSMGRHVRHRSCENLSGSFRSFESSCRAAAGLGFDADHHETMLHQSSRVHAANWDCDAYHDAVSLRDDFEATESRLQSVEAELDRMRQTLVQTLNLNSKSSTRSKPATVSSTPSGKVSTNTRRSSSSVSSSCCMSNLKPGHRTGGLVSKALQKLKFGSSTPQTETDPLAPTLAEQLKVQDVEMNGQQSALPSFILPGNDKNTPAFRTPSSSASDISRSCHIPQNYARQNLRKPT